MTPSTMKKIIGSQLCVIIPFSLLSLANGAMASETFKVTCYSSAEVPSFTEKDTLIQVSESAADVIDNRGYFQIPFISESVHYRGTEPNLKIFFTKEEDKITFHAKILNIGNRKLIRSFEMDNGEIPVSGTIGKHPKKHLRFEMSATEVNLGLLPEVSVILEGANRKIECEIESTFDI